MDPRTAPPPVLHERLSEAIRRTGLSKAEFAERAGVDRTTLSQLLSPAGARQPRVDTLRALAAAHELSIDWLVGLSNAGPVEAELLDHTSFEAPGPSPTDEKLLGWLGEAADYKIRYVPSTLPDLLKTDAVIRFERSRAEGPNVAQTIETTEAQLSWARHPDTEMECCSSTQALASFARGEGMWSRLGVEARREQLDRMITLVDELYPTFRWFLFDGSRRYAAPVTVFGPKRAALYLGQLYLVLTSAEHVRTLSRHFDSLIRDADVQPTSMGNHLARLRKRVVGRAQPPAGRQLLREEPERRARLRLLLATEVDAASCPGSRAPHRRQRSASAGAALRRELEDVRAVGIEPQLGDHLPLQSGWRELDLQHVDRTERHHVVQRDALGRVVVVERPLLLAEELAHRLPGEQHVAARPPCAACPCRTRSTRSRLAWRRPRPRTRPPCGGASGGRPARPAAA